MIAKIFTFQTDGAGSETGLYFENEHRNLNFKFTALLHKYNTGLVQELSEANIAETLNFINNDADFLEFANDVIVKPSDFNTLVLPDKWQFAIPVQPSKIIAIARNYAEHAKESGKEVSEEPVFFAKLPSTLRACCEPVKIPKGVGRVDHEVELAVIMGKDAKNVSETEALAYVAGYTIANDITARELQAKDRDGGHPYTRAKGFDTFCPCGPYLMPAKFIGDPHNLDIELSVNKKVKQSSNTRHMVFSIGKLIAHISRICTLKTGDLILTGTPEGVSPLQPGDAIEASIQSIGKLESPAQ